MIEVFTNYAKGRATLNFVVARKEWSIFFECNHEDHVAPAVWDFAAFACLTIADRFKQNVCLHAPVTRTAMDNCRKISEYIRLCDAANEPYFVQSNNVVDDISPQGNFSSLCVSTGVDSTYTLIAHHEKMKFTHGLIVHGADYPAHEVEGFNALLKRVESLCRKSDIKPIVVVTNLRDLKFNWGKLHIMQLVACMQFLGGKFENVSYSADFTISEDLTRSPWSNNYYVGMNVAGGQTHTHYLGYELDRYHKIEAILKDGRYIDDIGVCYSDVQEGGNCGKCLKCIRT